MAIHLPFSSNIYLYISTFLYVLYFEILCLKEKLKECSVFIRIWNFICRNDNLWIQPVTVFKMIYRNRLNTDNDDFVFNIA